MLNERFRLAQVDELVARKRAGPEKLRLDTRDLHTHGELLDLLEERLRQAYGASTLPEEALSVQALEDFVIDLRLEAARSQGC